MRNRAHLQHALPRCGVERVLSTCAAEGQSAVAPTAGESVPAALLKLLGAVYRGKCQITGFGFLTSAGSPYFELHLLNPELDHHHPKNLLVVCPNTRAQFKYGRTEDLYDADGWIRLVKLGDEDHLVRQIIDDIHGKFRKETRFLPAD